VTVLNVSALAFFSRGCHQTSVQDKYDGKAADVVPQETSEFRPEDLILGIFVVSLISSRPVPG
jgi:hypothetical protein